MATRNYHIRYQTDREYFAGTSSYLTYRTDPFVGYGFTDFANSGYAVTIPAKIVSTIDGKTYENTTSAVNAHWGDGKVLNTGSRVYPAHYWYETSEEDYSLNLEHTYLGSFSKASWDKIGWGTDYATFTNNVISWCRNNLWRISSIEYSNDINVIIWWNDNLGTLNSGNNLCSCFIYAGNDTSANEIRTLEDTSDYVHYDNTLTPW